MKEATREMKALSILFLLVTVWRRSEVFQEHTIDGFGELISARALSPWLVRIEGSFWRSTLSHNGCRTLCVLNFAFSCAAEVPFTCAR